MQPLTPPITSLGDFEEFSHVQELDGLRHLSLSVLEHMSFEREALRCALVCFGPRWEGGAAEGGARRRSWLFLRITWTLGVATRLQLELPAGLATATKLGLPQTCICPACQSQSLRVCPCHAKPVCRRVSVDRKQQPEDTDDSEEA